MPKRFPEDLPLFGTLAFGLGFLTFGFTGMLVESYAGRPSSTSAIGYVIVPIWSLGWGGIGYLLGQVVRFVWNRFSSTTVEAAKPSKTLPIALAAVVLVAALSGAAVVFVYETESQPSVIVDTGVVSSQFAANSDSPVRSATRIYDFEKVPEVIAWGQNESELNVNGLRVLLKDRRRHLSADVTASGLDYINYIHAAHLVASGKRDPFLVLVVAGRATGRRAFVVVLNADYEVVYSRRIERFWELKASPLEIRLDPVARREIPVIGPTCKESLTLHVQ